MSNLTNIKKDIILDIPRLQRTDPPLVESISRKIVLESEWFFNNDRVLNPNRKATGQIISQISLN